MLLALQTCNNTTQLCASVSALHHQLVFVEPLLMRIHVNVQVSHNVKDCKHSTLPHVSVDANLKFVHALRFGTPLLVGVSPIRKLDVQLVKL